MDETTDSGSAGSVWADDISTLISVGELDTCTCRYGNTVLLASTIGDAQYTEADISTHGVAFCAEHKSN